MTREPIAYRGRRARSREPGFEVDFNGLVYYGHRSHIVEFLTQRGWRAETTSVKDLHVSNGFDYPGSGVAAAFADVTYASAVLAQ